ncbi:MAG: AAA family ATPase [Gammaproteobacteria bacterium]|jgi:replicative DNA helicase|nr:AAA family ATPase [Gammaproteobacteria bacterium]MBT4606352.1 AAA family ATPase [Thiotrichales bacterium]MBT4081545.1 AAA family ATPase [Gammaproteobacteria bacterium]MBT4331377.1 AAA family ATPase [Gammaproteobacteria bacterium]MBT4789017.1 AAA family ATPase [Gammaproteobacteria bacterium]
MSNSEDLEYLEQSVISALLKEPDRIHEISNKLNASDFTGTNNRRSFELISQAVANGEAVDAMVLAEKGGNLQYLIEVARNITGVPANIGHYTDALLERIKKRKASTLFQQAGEKLLINSSEEVLAWLNGELSTVERSAGSEMSAKEVITAALHSMDDAREQRESNGTNGSPWALQSLNNAMGGIDGPRLYIVAARPGCGKTAIAQQTAVAAASAGFGVGVCSLEIDASEIGRRWISHYGQANISGLSRGYEKFFDDAFKAGQKLSELPLFVDDDSYSLDAVCSRITRWRREGKVDLAIVDHIGLVEYSKNKNRNDGLGEISRRLKKLAKQLDMPIVALSQMNRGSEKDNRRPQLSDLRDSGNIEQDADAAIFLNKTKDDHIEIGVLKNRMGEIGWRPERFEFDGAVQTFREIGTFPDGGTL